MATAFKFYEEYPSASAKRQRRDPSGNVLAVYHPRLITGSGTIEALGAVTVNANAPVASCSVDKGYLSTKCRLIAEGEARKIHPALFSRLDQDK